MLVAIGISIAVAAIAIALFFEGWQLALGMGADMSAVGDLF